MANDKQLHLAHNRTLNILGASARSAALSAVRAGFVPVACDRFGDTDLREVAEYREPAGPYPEGLLECLADMPDAPWIYTGALENHPGLIERLAKRRPLWGNGADVLLGARDPCALAKALHDGGVPCAPAQPSLSGGGQERWVKKSRGARTDEEREPNCYQRWIPGTPGSALYVATQHRCVLLGATRQLIGEPWLHAPPMAWCGNVGPRVLSVGEQESLEKIGAVLRRAFSLRGLFGVDFIETQRTTTVEALFVPIEVNPRYTGAVELIEQACGIEALALHASAFDGTPEDRLEQLAPQPQAARDAVLAKAILYAPTDVTVGVDLARRYARPAGSFPVAADLPPTGTRIAKGEPILSLFARSAEEDECIARLQEEVLTLLPLLEPSEPSPC